RRHTRWPRDWSSDVCSSDLGKKFRLADHDAADTAGLGPKEKAKAKDLMQRGMARLTELQDRLYAHDRWAVLLIFQAMDAAGKDRSEERRVGKECGARGGGGR